MDPLVFRQVCKRLKFKPSADLFASATHKQLHRYYSRTPDPSDVGTSALSFDWQAESATSANPPWSLMPQVLSKIVADEVRLMVVVTEWTHALRFKLFRRLVERKFRVDGPLYLTGDGELQPAPRWASVIAVVDRALYLQSCPMYRHAYVC